MAAELAAFVFVGREKDYGGVHLGIPRGAVHDLADLIGRLVERPLGRTRELSLRAVPEHLPAEIVGRLPYRPLERVRVGRPASGTSRVEAAGRLATLWFSAEKLAVLAAAIEGAATAGGDLVVVGDSGAWTDRVWCWPLDVK